MIQQFLILLLLGAALFADVNSSKSVDAEINEIRAASPSERVALMNAFKQRMMQMSENERSEAIQAMRTKMHKRASRMQMQNSEQMSHYQNMNQRQVGSEFSKGANSKKDAHSTMMQKR